MELPINLQFVWCVSKCFVLHVYVWFVCQALELVQDSKATIFLVLELARGGELFDRIKVNNQSFG